MKPPRDPQTTPLRIALGVALGLVGIAGSCGACVKAVYPELTVAQAFIFAFGLVGCGCLAALPTLLRRRK